MTQSKPILVTGAAGFIGARFAESCMTRRIPVISVDSPAYFTERAEHRNLSFGTIVDFEKLFSWLEAEKPALSGIVHMGACSDTFEMDERFLNRVNFDYSKNIWNYASKNRIPLVYASSGATYGAGNAGYEDDERRIQELHPLNPYGVSKQKFDVWALNEEKKDNRPPSWAGFKFFNVYGFGERHKGRMSSVVLHAFDQIRGTGRIRLFKSHREGIADGQQKRDFVYVGDVVDVMHFALEKPVSRGIFNLGSGKARSFLDLARAVFKAMGREEKIEFINTPVEIRDKYQYFTEARMERLLAEGYPRRFTTLEDGVEAYVKKLLESSANL